MIPKNIRQIGEGDSSRRVYIEDYVITFLKQIQKKLSGSSRSVSLYGNIFEENGITYVIVKGASAPSDKEKYFKDAAVVGQAVIMRDSGGLGKLAQMSGMLSPDAPGRSVYYEIRENDLEDLQSHRNDIFECSSLFFLERGKLEPLKTYYLFYEKNDPMQEYLIEWNSKGQELKTENAGDNAVSTFRKNYYEKQEFFMQKKLMAYFYALSCFMLIISCVIGISMINSYGKMKNLETAMSHLAMAISEQRLPDAETAQQTDNPAVTAWTREEPRYDAAIETEVQPVTDQTENAVQENGDETGTAVGQETDRPTEEAQDAVTVQQQAVETVSGQVYVVQEGDTLADISRKFYNTNQKVDEICNKNNIKDPNKIVMGEKIILP